jgi:hypothetical protein
MPNDLHYNQRLGNIQMANSPTFERRSWGTRNHSYRLVTLPNTWIVNQHSGLNQVPRDVQISVNFSLLTNFSNSLHTAYTAFVPNDLSRGYRI